MFVQKKILYYILALTILPTIFFSCENYVERGIEGQWQMTSKINDSGEEVVIDTIYYSFKNGVFRYLRLDTEVKTFIGYGNYKKDRGNLNIEIDPTTLYPCESENCITKLEWNGETNRTFIIKKQTSSQMELVFNKYTYRFRKY